MRSAASNSAGWHLIQDGLNHDRSMASKFFHVHHEFRAGKAQQWWETAQATMAPGG